MENKKWRAQNKISHKLSHFLQNNFIHSNNVIKSFQNSQFKFFHLQIQNHKKYLRHKHWLVTNVSKNFRLQFRLTNKSLVFKYLFITYRSIFAHNSWRQQILLLRLPNFWRPKFDQLGIQNVILNWKENERVTQDFYLEVNHPGHTLLNNYCNFWQAMY